MKWTFPVALTFLTILPWPRLSLVDSRDLARALLWFPWVGAILGLLFWGLMAGLTTIVSSSVAAAVLLTVTVIITRGLHLDGLADTADGLAGGRTPEERRRLMKDPRLGAFGAMSLTMVLLLKYALIIDLLHQGLTRGLLLFPIVSRWGMVLLAYLSPYARPEGGLGEAMTVGVSGPILLGATVSTLFLAGGAAGLLGLFIMGVSTVLLWLASRLCRHWFGGVTGDVLGAANEMVEVLTMMLVAVCPGKF